MNLKEAEAVLAEHKFTPGRDSTRRHPARAKLKVALQVISKSGKPTPVYEPYVPPEPVKNPRQPPPKKAKKAAPIKE